MTSTRCHFKVAASNPDVRSVFCVGDYSFSVDTVGVLSNLTLLTLDSVSKHTEISR